MRALRAGAQAVGRELARGIAWQAERLGDRSPSRQSPSAARTRPSVTLSRDARALVRRRNLVDQRADRVEDRVERVAIAGEDHPAASAPAPSLPKASKVGSTMSRASPRRGARRPIAAVIASPTLSAISSASARLEPGGRAEMMEQVGVGAADPRRDRLERHRLRRLRSISRRARPRPRRRGFLRATGVCAFVTLLTFMSVIAIQSTAMENDLMTRKRQPVFGHPGRPHHHSARPPLRPRRGDPALVAWRAVPRRPHSTTRCRRPSRSARRSSSRACASSATAPTPRAGRGDQGVHDAGSDPQPRASGVQPPRRRRGL